MRNYFFSLFFYVTIHKLLGIFLILSMGLTLQSQPADTLIQTAHQVFNSRIYLMDGQGNTMNYYDYENYRMVGMTIAGGELYVADAFGPVVLKVDLEDGSLENFILELPHTAYYGLAHDSNYFYVEDFGTLYRYDEQGEQQSSTSFGETIFGMAWDGQYLWTIVEDDDMIRCWDLSGWPELTEVEENAVAKPSGACRGLFYDGAYFWTSESLEAVAGEIYRLDHEGNIVETYDNASNIGWGVAALLDNTSTGRPGFALSSNAAGYYNEQTQELIVSIDEKLNKTTVIEIFDTRGRVHESKTLPGGKERYAIPLKGLNPGIYLFSLTTGGESYSGKFRVKR